MSALTAPALLTGNKGLITSTFGRATKGSKTIYANALIALDTSRYAVPAAGTVGFVCCGVADLGDKESLVTTTDGAENVKVRTGVFPFDIGTSGDALAKADELNDVYVIDDHTVGKTDGGVGRPIAGQLWYIGDKDGTQNPNGAVAWTSVGGPRLPNVGATVGRGSFETITSGAPSVNVEITFLSITGTVAFGALPDGKYIGQRKVFMVTVAASTPVGSLTVTTKNGFASITGLGAVGRTLELEWTGSAGWAVIGNGGATIA